MYRFTERLKKLNRKERTKERTSVLFFTEKRTYVCERSQEIFRIVWKLCRGELSEYSENSPRHRCQNCQNISTTMPWSIVKKITKKKVEKRGWQIRERVYNISRKREINERSKKNGKGSWKKNRKENRKKNRKSFEKGLTNQPKGYIIKTERKS